MDWMFRVAYANARTQGDAELMKKVSVEYLKFADAKFEFCERVANELFGHPIVHVLLLHANELNADNFDALAGVIRNRGYQFVTLERALQDPVYKFSDKYQPTSNWLRQWSLSGGKKFEGPQPPEFIQKIYEDDQNGRSPKN